MIINQQNAANQEQNLYSSIVRFEISTVLILACWLYLGSHVLDYIAIVIPGDIYASIDRFCSFWDSVVIVLIWVKFAIFYLLHLIRTTNTNLEFLQRIFVYLLC